jgi:hypothetical protein
MIRDRDRANHCSLEPSLIPRGLNILAGDDPSIWISVNSVTRESGVGSVFERVVLPAAPALASQLSSQAPRDRHCVY